MRREYKAYINGARLTDGTNKIIVNGTECRRCLVNGVDIIKSFAQLKLRFTMTGTVDAYSWYLSDPDYYEDRSGYGSWNIASESVALLTNDFTINSFSFRFYIQDGTGEDDDTYRHFSPSRSTTTFPYTATNVTENMTTDTGGATTSKSYGVFVRISANVTYVPTGQTFTVNSEDFLFDEGTISGGGGDSWSEAISFNKTLDVLIEREVAQY